MKNIYIIIGILLCLSSCRVTRDRCNQLYPPVVTHSSDTVVQVKETVKDTTIYIPADEASLTALIECDSLNQVVIRELKNEVGKRTSIKLQTERNNKVLAAMLKCNVDSQGVYITFKIRDTNIDIIHRET